VANVNSVAPLAIAAARARSPAAWPGSAESEVEMRQRNSNLKTRLSSLLILLALPIFVGSAGRPQASARGKLVQIHMTARKYTFDPNVINVREGDQVELVVTATDRDHGIAIPAFGVQQVLKKGVPTTVRFIANKPGTFTFHCSVFCGLGHRHMKGKLVVKAE
jgi:cytochrome c oxidase subunit 2